MNKSVLFTLVSILIFFVVGCAKKEYDQFDHEPTFSFDHRTRFEQPPKKIPVPFATDAPLLGNGYTGVAISGSPDSLGFHFARNDFWRLKSGLNESFPAVLGKLDIHIPGLNGASYLIEQDLFTASTHGTFSLKTGTVWMSTFVSATQDLMVIKLESDLPMPLNGSFNLRLPGSAELIDKPPFDKVFPAKVSESQVNPTTSLISRGFEDDVDISSKAAIAIKSLNFEGRYFELNDSEPLYLVAAFSSNFKSDDCVEEVKQMLKDLELDDLKVINADHKKWWQEFWNKSNVQLPDSIIEQHYYRSQYVLGSFCRDEDFPPSIFGTTITKERPHWNGDYHLNYNHYAPYYGLYSSNHLVQALPNTQTLFEQIERGNYYSASLQGIKGGILLPVGAGPLGIETTRKNDLMTEHRKNWFEEGNVEGEGLFFGQKSNAAYAVVNMASHFYYSYDPEYVKKSYPFVRGVAKFWEEYLTWQKDEDRYVILNDAIHEGTVGTMNPILSLGMVRLVMQTAIDMSSFLNVDKERSLKWQHVLDHLSKYPIQERNGKEVFRYTEKGTSWWGDNTLGIQHIYPAGQLGLDADEELLEVALNTIDEMQRWIDFNGSNSFFPAAVRVGYEPDSIWTQLRKYSLHTYPNGFQKNNPHGIENLSTVPNTVNEMLCMSYKGWIRLFEVWPEHLEASFTDLRAHGAFLISADFSNGRVGEVRIKSERGRLLRLVNPWEEMKVIVLRNDKKEEVVEGERLQIETEPGEILFIKQAVN